jgi:hypothetical protein
MTITLNRIDVRDFMIRGHHKVQPEDYLACAAADPKGIELIEQALGKELLAFRSWREIFDQVDTSLTDGVLLRLQILYSQYMLAKIKRALKGILSSQDEITTGYRYYQEQIPHRHKLLEKWVSHNPQDRHLLANLEVKKQEDSGGDNISPKAIVLL